MLVKVDQLMVMDCYNKNFVIKIFLDVSERMTIKEVESIRP